jgi:putative DNA primase/helicase
MGQWYQWAESRWRRDADDAYVRELARGLARTLPEDEKDEKTFKRNSLSAAGLSAAVRVSASDARIAIRADDLDAHPHLLNTPAGTVDLATGEVMPHDPDLLLTRATTVHADLEAPRPRWEGFMDETFGGDLEMIAYLQQLAGLALLGDVREHILPLLYGTGANGKGALLLVWQTILGVADVGGYAQSAPDGFLMAGRDGGHPTDIARLRGARLLIASEQTGGKKFDEAKVKRLTGGDMLTGRFDFKPSHMIVVATNHLPAVPEGGPSFWRRARLINFSNVVPEDRRDPDLHNRLVAEEGAAILGWMVQGAMAVLASGVKTPAKVLAATDDYRVSEDTLASFVRDECIVNPHSFVTVPDFTHRYEAHCREMGVEPLSAKHVTMRLTSEYAITQGRRSRPAARLYHGLELVQNDDEE